jgi:uncharacterized protein (DUF58 family)
MDGYQIEQQLASLNEGELSRFARVADRFLVGHPTYSEGGSLRKTHAGAGLEFLDFQAYVPGDDARSVDWRASARRGRYLVRRYHDDASSEWYLCLDRSASMGSGGEAKWILALQLAAAFAYLLLNRAHRVGLLLFSGEVDGYCPLGRGRGQYRKTYRLLADARPRFEGGDSNLEACCQRVPRRRSEVVISDFLRPDAMQPGLGRLARLGGSVHALQVISSAEYGLAISDAQMPLRDVESGEQLWVDTRGQGLLSAEEQLLRQQRGLAAYCHRRRVPFTSCRAGDLWKSVLISHFSGAFARHA